MAGEVGIDEVIAEVLPADKAAVVARLQAEGRVVAMVGDGVNDAPALAQADLGLGDRHRHRRRHRGLRPDLICGDLRAAADAIRLSRRTLATIKGNLFWAFAYNVAALPAGRRRPPQPADRRRGDGLLERLRGHQLAAPAPLQSAALAAATDQRAQVAAGDIGDVSRATALRISSASSSRR